MTARARLTRVLRKPVAQPQSTGLVLGRRSYAYRPPRIIRHVGDPDYPVTVGAFSSLAEDVTFLVGGNHRIDWLSTFPFDGVIGRGHPASRGPIVVGNDVWIGMGATILSGVTIGDGAVVGGFSVVASDIAPYTIAAGNPAREIRSRFSEHDINTLLELRWWDWPDDDIDAAIPVLTGGTVADLAELATSRSIGRR